MNRSFANLFGRTSGGAGGPPSVQTMSSLTVTTLTVTGVGTFAAGSAAAPSVAVGEPDVGLYRYGANILGISAGGVVQAAFGAGGLFNNGLYQAAPAGYYGWGAAAFDGAPDLTLYRDAADALAQRRTTNAQESRLYGTYTDGTNYQRVSRKVAKASVTAAVGPTATAANLIPDGAALIGVSTRVTTALGVSTGTTGYQVGDGSDADRWGNITGTAIGTTSDNRNATAAFGGYFTSANNVVLTANGGDFDGTGVIEVCAFYDIVEAD